MASLHDLSHPIEDGMVTYPGLPAPRITAHLSREDARREYADGATFHIARIDMVANTGTYLDTPAHRWADGYDLAALPLEACAGLQGVLVDATALPGRGIDEDVFTGADVAGRAVLVRTGWDAHWRTEKYLGEHPHLTAAAAQALVAAGAALVGIDSANIDDTSARIRPVHAALLRAGIPIVEHLTALRPLVGKTFEFFAVPAPVRGMGTFPVRAFARLP